MAYEAVAREVIQRDGEGRPAASLFGLSYIRMPVGDPANRPVTFVVHGGPGAASFPMHMGLLGPRRLQLPADGVSPMPPPYRLVDNEGSLLDVTDLVFIDPAGTGQSRVLEDGKAADYLGVVGDAKSVAAYVRTWLTENGRWSSPRFIIGESYGSIRAVLVTRELIGGRSSGQLNGVAFNGIVLLGQLLNVADRDLEGHTGADRSFQLIVPAMAAVAWYHGKIDRGSRTLEQVVSDARAFIADEYPRALFAGNALDEASRRRVAERLSGLIGLPAELILQQDLRISVRTFSMQLLADRGQVLGLYDARYVAPAPTIPPDLMDDASLAQLMVPYAAAIHDELPQRFGIPADLLRDLPYRLVDWNVNSAWSHAGRPVARDFANYAPILGAALKQNPALHLMVGSGYYDLVTPFGVADYMATHLGVGPERIVVKHFESGHMAFVGERPRLALQADLRAFIQTALRER